MDRDRGTGLLIAQHRALKGMTQKELAEAVGRIVHGTGYSDAYVSMIENGRRIVDKHSVLNAFAEALGVSVNDITGRPYHPTTRGDLELVMAAPRIRTALDEPEDGPVTARPLAELDRAADQVMAARMACDMPTLGRLLPDLIAETRKLWFDDGNREAAELLVKAACAGSLALKSAGWVDLAIRLADLADTVSRSHGDPVVIAAAQFTIAQCALSTGGRRRSVRIANTAAEELDRLTRASKLPPMLHNDMLSWMGMLHLHAALSEAVLGEGDPQQHLATAASLAPRVIGDPWRMECTPANVDVWKIGVQLETGNPDLVPQIARHVNVNTLHTPQRRSRLWLDAGRAAHMTGDTDGAVRFLLLADEAAPGDLRQRGQAVEIVGHLVRSGRPSDELHDLAVRVGVTPAAS